MVSSYKNAFKAFDKIQCARKNICKIIPKVWSELQSYDLQEVKWKLLSYVWLFATLWIIQSMEFSWILEWVAFPFSRGSSLPRDQTRVSCIAAAKSLQSYLTLCNPIDGSTPGSPSPRDSPGKNIGVGCHFLLQCMKVKVKTLSRVQLFVTPCTAAHQAPPSMGFSRQEYWSGVPLPSPAS